MSALIGTTVALISLLVLFVHSGFVLAGQDDHRKYRSGIFDMDVARVTSDWTSYEGGRRTNIHPLYKILVAPIGKTINALCFDGKNHLSAVRTMTVASMVIYCALAGLLAFQLTAGSWLAAVMTILLTGVSFSSVLLASIPESASISGLTTLLPLVFLGTRVGRDFSSWEAVGWGFLAMVCFAITITQIAHWAIALGGRVYLAQRSDGDAEFSFSSSMLAKAALIAIVAFTLIGGGTALQKHLSPNSNLFYRLDLMSEESLYLRTADIVDEPMSHIGRICGHFFVYGFVAPYPSYSRVLMRMYDLDYFSLSIEEQTLSGWTPLQGLLAIGFVLLVYSLALAGGRPQRLLIAPLLSVGFSMILHFIYGREYIMYSPNWHGVLVAILVARIWPVVAKHRRTYLLVFVLLAGAIAWNSISVMSRVYSEFRHGLESSLRDEHGAPLVQMETP